ncbi:putative 2-amino-4-hydroxy-6-hydroxymethyldihydropteridine diphosphokinase [Carpediemonas membranifera]|uniref:Putative 2-amino-4-hydroxy-6-hydroxymethyldihydropteridine diphosphokinase n=1 Tax=Carpediemonas membranifera TaxID=201153 RepID=A0A8J6E640_9EUKA|nr:putative 2-amino-4-hydroxy-6-hydroxymethyldihydropteridine diphosphokinase [Carpediemonas membranifera]|eukprot:KAG9396652.1 putative 2-amino-4-hydroxy-6-hydroxymethyldihydropteridine diphosphokinase [Carpediemonas membranifera]
MPSAAEIALQHFRKKPLKLNCAQTVLNACAHLTDIDSATFEASMTEYKAYGHGGHESGKCGAYYAACELLKGEKAVSGLTGIFTRGGSSIICDELREVNKMSCHDCVRTAAEYVEQHYKLDG